MAGALALVVRLASGARLRGGAGRACSKFAAVREAVKRDYLDAARAAANAKRMAELRERYTVVRE